MRLPTPLHPATFIRRYKRFLADFQWPDGSTVTAHCANSGSMLGLLQPGAATLLSHHDNPRRKLAYTWELTRENHHWVGLHTGRTNAIVEEALVHGRLTELANYRKIQREVKVSQDSRLDFRLTAGELPPCFVEVKSVTLRQGEVAAFPDAVTLRGRRHLEELATLKQQGGRSVLLFVVQRQDCHRFRPAHAIDPAYAATLRQVVEAGVEVLVWACSVTPDAITLNRPLPWELEPA